MNLSPASIPRSVLQTLASVFALKSRSENPQTFVDSPAVVVKYKVKLLGLQLHTTLSSVEGVSVIFRAATKTYRRVFDVPT